jgi:hypothetical protein
MFTNILNDAAIGEADAEFQSTVLANRSLCSLKVGDAVAALADARRCTQLRPVWPKAHYRLLSALLALNLKQDAYRHARSLKRDLVASEDDLRALVESISRAFIEDVHYSAHREATRVRFIDIARGKGLFTSESVRPLTALVVESPLASVANFNIDKSVHEFCDHCMQTRLSAKALGGGELVELLYGSSGAPSWTACRAAPACSMRYCSSACRDAAWSSYHEALCAGSVHIGSEQSLQRQAALAAIQALAVKSNRRNVWLIARLLAREVCGQARVAAREQVSRELQSHDNFVYAPDAAEPSDAELVVLLRRLLGATSCVTEQRVAVLNGVIGYNASDCAPVSDLHKLLLRMPLAQRATTLRRLDGVVRGEADVRDELLSDVPSLKRLVCVRACVRGCCDCGVFTLAV